MNAPDLFAWHEWLQHLAYTQAQLHPLEANAWLQTPFYLDAMAWMCVGAFIGWWAHRLMRGERASAQMHERNGKRYEQHASGSWLQHWHDPETGKLARLEVLDDAPIGTGPAPQVNLTSRRQKLV